MATINVYEQYFKAECTFNDVERHAASVMLISTSENGSIKYEVAVNDTGSGDWDFTVGVIDPLPSSLVKGADMIGKLRELPEKVFWIINMDNEGVNRRELRRFLGFMPDFSQEAVPRELITRAEYNCVELEELCPLKGIEKLAEEIRKRTS